MVNNIRLEDVVFFIFLAIILGTSLWLFSGSPPEISAIITIGIAVIGSEFLLWKKLFLTENKFNSKLFKRDKKTSLGFMKVKHDLNLMENRINNRFDKIENSLNNIESKMK